MRKCTNCYNRGLVTDATTGEVICSSCGIVLEYQTDDVISLTREEYIDRNSNHITLARHDKGLNTKIDSINIDAFGNRIDNNMHKIMSRVRVLDARTKTQSSLDRSLFRTMQELNKLKHKLNLSNEIIEEAAIIYRKAKAVRRRRGDTIATAAAASIYIACKRFNMARSIKDIANACNIKQSALFRSYKNMVFDLDLNLPLNDNKKLVSKLANSLNIDGRVSNECIYILSRMKELELMEGKNPMSLVAAVLYIVSKENRIPLRLKHVAIASGISDVTIRKIVKELEHSNLLILPL